MRKIISAFLFLFLVTGCSHFGKTQKEKIEASELTKFYASDTSLDYDEKVFPLSKQIYSQLSRQTKAFINYLILLYQEKRIDELIEKDPVLGSQRWHIRKIKINDSVGKSVSVSFEEGHYEKTVHFVYRRLTRNWFRIGSNTGTEPKPVLKVKNVNELK